MVFHLLSNDRLKATLTAQDARRLQLEWENEDPQALRQLKRGLLGLLAEARTRLGFFPASRRMLIEVYPDEQGGATVYFCADPPPGEEPESFCFSDADSLIEAAARLVPLCGHRLCGSALYRCRGLWWLVIRPMDGQGSDAGRLLAEYACRSSAAGFDAAAIEEHALPILREQAADTLFYYFGKPRPS